MGNIYFDDTFPENIDSNNIDKQIKLITAKLLPETNKLTDQMVMRLWFQMFFDYTHNVDEDDDMKHSNGYDVLIDKIVKKINLHTTKNLVHFFALYSLQNLHLFVNMSNEKGQKVFVIYL